MQQMQKCIEGHCLGNSHSFQKQQSRRNKIFQRFESPRMSFKVKMHFLCKHYYNNKE